MRLFPSSELNVLSPNKGFSTICIDGSFCVQIIKKIKHTDLNISCYFTRKNNKNIYLHRTFRQQYLSYQRTNVNYMFIYEELKCLTKGTKTLKSLNSSLLKSISVMKTLKPDENARRGFYL